MPITTVIRPQGPIARLATKLMDPLMLLAAGTISESPQQTHMWNSNRPVRLSKGETGDLVNEGQMVCAIRIVNAVCNKEVEPHGVLTRIPILGGWREYVVVAPDRYFGVWHVGWIYQGWIGHSRIPIPHGQPARLLLAPKVTHFFGVCGSSRFYNEQIKIVEIGRGKIGDKGRYRKVLLL